MAIQQGNTSSLGYQVEVTPGVTPAAAFKLLRHTTESLNSNVTTVVSTELRSDRATSDLVRTNQSEAGSVGFELSYAEYEPFIAAAVGGTFSTLFTLTATDLSFSSVDNSINSLAAAFSTTTILPGHYLKIAGAALPANNGIVKVVSVTTAKIIVSHKTFTTAIAGPSITVKGKSVRNGVVKPFYSLQRSFPDITQFIVHRGMVVNGLTLNVASGALVSGSLDFMGMNSGVAATTFGTGADVVATTNGILSAQANVGTVFKSGVAQTGVYFKKLDTVVNNNSRALDAIGTLGAIGINHGSISVKTSVSAFFSDTSLLADFLAGTANTLSYSLTDDAGNALVIDMYGKFDTGTVTGAQLNTDMMVDLSLTSIVNPTLGYMIQISVLPA